jgi:DNA helicase-2/ATP-dependent DNA helicase PcrA
MNSSHPLLAKLNPVQQQAVQHVDGPLLIFAGAGSGKTRVLTHRVAYLLSECGIAPWNVLAVTFTNKAASEMRERIEGLVGDRRAKSIWIGTFHAVCARMLRQSGNVIDIPKDFVVYDTADQTSLIRECMRDLDLDEKRYAPRQILGMISKAKEKLVAPENYSEHFAGYNERVAGQVYTEYQRRLVRNRALDFDDLIRCAVDMFKASAEVLAKYQEQFQYIMVDEYQDVNYSQYYLLKLLSAKYRNLCVVGDDDQSIYRFRGAEVELILQFEKDYPDTQVVKLEQNYRSTQKILDAAHAVVSNNPGRASKKLWTDNEGGTPIELIEAMNEQEEGVYVARVMRDLVERGDKSWGDFAILYRTNAQSRAFEEVFLHFRVPYKIVGGVRFYDRKEIKDVIAYLRVLSNPFDSVSIKRIINTPPRGIGQGTIAQLEDYARQSSASFWEVLQHGGQSGMLSPRARTAVHSFVIMLDDLRNEHLDMTVTDLTQQVLRRSGYIDDLTNDRSPEAQSRLENVQELLSVTTRYDSEAESPTLTGFLEQVSLVSDLDSLVAGQEAVTMMTLHSSKGLEFPVVFLAGMEENIFPHSRSRESDKDLEEERRLCYVGITRAKDQLHLTHASRRTLMGSLSANPPSRFLREIPSELFAPGSRSSARAVARVAPEFPVAQPQVRQRMWETATPTPRQSAIVSNGLFRAGQKVRHSQFGLGVVLSAQSVGEDVQVSVAFPDVGIKKLLQSFAKLTAV